MLPKIPMPILPPKAKAKTTPSSDEATENLRELHARLKAFRLNPPARASKMLWVISLCKVLDESIAEYLKDEK